MIYNLLYPFQVADNLEKEKADHIEHFGGHLRRVRMDQSVAWIVTLIL